MKQIILKSTPENWEKEKDGRKPNTLRTKESFIEHNEGLWPLPDRVVIENTQTHKVFGRMITDITFWEGWVIISWKHEAD
jgi:hypothetical protein